MAGAQHSSKSAEHYTPPEISAATRAVLGGIDLDPFSCALANLSVRAARFFCLDAGGLLPPTAEEQPEAAPSAGEVADGFEVEWAGRVQCNPPGGVGNSGESRQCRAWFKAVREWMSGRVPAAVFVCFSLELLQRTQGHELRVGRDLSLGAGLLPVPLDFPICYPARRLAYSTPAAGGGLARGGQPPHASCLVLLPDAGPNGGTRGADPLGWCGSARARRQVEAFRREFSQFGRVVVPA